MFCACFVAFYTQSLNWPKMPFQFFVQFSRRRKRVRKDEKKIFGYYDRGLLLSQKISVFSWVSFCFYPFICVYCLYACLFRTPSSFLYYVFSSLTVFQKHYVRVSTRNWTNFKTLFCDSVPTFLENAVGIWEYEKLMLNLREKFCLGGFLLFLSRWLCKWISRFTSVAYFFFFHSSSSSL